MQKSLGEAHNGVIDKSTFFKVYKLILFICTNIMVSSIFIGNQCFCQFLFINYKLLFLFLLIFLHYLKNRIPLKVSQRKIIV